jgi:beta-glucosidase
MVKTGSNLLAHARTLTNAQGDFGQAASVWRSASIDVAVQGQAVLVVRKTGYLPRTVELTGVSGSVETVVLQRDPLEARIDSVMAMMTTADKIAQMTQPHLSTPTSNWGGNSTSHTGGTPSHLFGSVLNGGDGYSDAFLNTMATTLNTWPAGRARIPTYYGKDAVHGNAGISGYTVFPHNIGLGATRDSALVRRIGEATAKEMWAARIDLNFSPAISVARDLRWGRTYESYGETAELSVQMGAAMVRGLQGDRFDAPWRVTATAKHFLADGGTTNGADRGNTLASDSLLRAIHLPGYEAVVEQGVLSVMASFNTIQTPGSSDRVHQHIDSLRMTGWLKTELGFDGYIISDWLGITNSENPGYTGDDYGMGGTPPPSRAAIRRAINAGIDLAMEPGTHVDFMADLTALVNDGSVSMDRVNDAVRRILRAKFRAGRMDNFGGPAGFVGNTANRASAEHRAIAREAVRKSQVLLKNDGSVLPLAKNARIHVFGSHHNDIGRQCGGWTITWRGVTGNSGGGGFMGGPAFNFTTYGASILQGMQQVSGQSSFTTAANADIIVYVTGEEPYAEWHGDITSLNFNPPAADMTNLQNYRDQGKKVVTIFVTGRPRIVPQLIERSDAFLVAWLPGTEGGGVADILFGDHPLVGKLPFTWPGSSGMQFPYGFGLNYMTTPDAPAAPTLASVSHNSVTLTANAAYEFSRNGETWQTSSVFDSLTPETEYTFYQRVAATATANASAASPPFAVTTEIDITSVADLDRKIPDFSSANSDRDDRRPSAVTINEFTAGPNPVARSNGVVNFFRDGKRIKSGNLAVYNASGTRVKRIAVSDRAMVDAGRRQVGSWDLKCARGRPVAEGTYLVRGTIRTADGETETISLILGVW